MGVPLFEAPVTVDPWLRERYESNAGGEGTYKGIVQQGTADIEGRVFVGTFVERRWR